jgi:hypothetical protein
MAFGSFMRWAPRATSIIVGVVIRAQKLQGARSEKYPSMIMQGLNSVRYCWVANGAYYCYFGYAGE